MEAIPGGARRHPWDLPLVLLGALLLLGLGYGLRDPWPPDEPRFALVAQEMLRSGEWLIPHRGGEIYADKPPVFMWLSAAAQWLTGSLRLGFLLPSLLGGLLTVALVFDLGRRLWGRAAAWSAVAILLATIQFPIQVRSAQIDALVTACITLGLYGLLRHLLLGPDWRWAIIGSVGMGIGVITKGVGFLPLLVLVPWALLRWRQPSTLPSLPGAAWGWPLCGLAFLLPILLWALPVLLEAQQDPAVAAYRDEIFLHQTAGRYADSWHHRKWFGYYLVQVIPVLWLPTVLFLPWLVPAWSRRWRNNDPATILLLAWIGLVLLFFSISPGKRGVYLLPCVPALALVTAPLLPDLLHREAARRTAWTAILVLGAAAILAAPILAWQTPRGLARAVEQAPDLHPLIAGATLGLLLLGLALGLGRHRGFLVLGLALLLGWTVHGLWVLPRLDPAKSAAPLAAALAARLGPTDEVAVLQWSEQILLHADRDLRHWGWKAEREEEWRQASTWMRAAPRRWLLVERRDLEALGAEPDDSDSSFLGSRSRRDWYLLDRQQIGSLRVRDE